MARTGAIPAAPEPSRRSVYAPINPPSPKSGDVPLAANPGSRMDWGTPVNSTPSAAAAIEPKGVMAINAIVDRGSELVAPLASVTEDAVTEEPETENAQANRLAKRIKSPSGSKAAAGIDTPAGPAGPAAAPADMSAAPTTTTPPAAAALAVRTASGTVRGNREKWRYAPGQQPEKRYTDERRAGIVNEARAYAEQHDGYFNHVSRFYEWTAAQGYWPLPGPDASAAADAAEEDDDEAGATPVDGGQIEEAVGAPLDDGDEMEEASGAPFQDGMNLTDGVPSPNQDGSDKTLNTPPMDEAEMGEIAGGLSAGAAMGTDAAGARPLTPKEIEALSILAEMPKGGRGVRPPAAASFELVFRGAPAHSVVDDSAPVSSGSSQSSARKSGRVPKPSRKAQEGEEGMEQVAGVKRKRAWE